MRTGDLIFFQKKGLWAKILRFFRGIKYDRVGVIVLTAMGVEMTKYGERVTLGPIVEGKTVRTTKHGKWVKSQVLKYNGKKGFTEFQWAAYLMRDKDWKNATPKNFQAKYL